MVYISRLKFILIYAYADLVCACADRIDFKREIYYEINKKFYTCKKFFIFIFTCKKTFLFILKNNLFKKFLFVDCVLTFPPYVCENL